MSRDVTWGFYIAQFTFLVGIAASAVMVVLPYYLHDWKEFGRITALGEFVAISAVIMCMLFILVDMGQPLAHSERIPLSLTAIDDVLGHDCAERVSSFECVISRVTLRLRTQRAGAARLDPAR